MVEPIFDNDALSVLAGEASIYDHVSEGSGKVVHVHFCRDCGTKLWLSFERFPTVIGVYAGTFDDPCWFAIHPETSKHIYLGVARRDSIVPPGLPTYVEHATTNDGSLCEPTIFATPHAMGE
jgi:hypothetical protein